MAVIKRVGMIGKAVRLMTAALMAAVAVNGGITDDTPDDPPDDPPDELPTHYTFSYEAGAGGKLLIGGVDAVSNPHVVDSVPRGEYGPEVEAVPDAGYYFVKWSDGVTYNPRVDLAESDTAVSASFVKLDLPDTIMISTFEQLDSVGKYPARYPLSWNYALSNDIDASESARLPGGQGFLPIGSRVVIVPGSGLIRDRLNTAAAFTGSFDGRGFEISNLYINRPDAKVDEAPVGLFGYTHGARIRNLRVAAADITGNRHVGALAGRTYETVIENCYSSGSVAGSVSNSGFDVGGLVGRAEDRSVISLSYSSASAAGRQYVGGFIGSSRDTKISESYALGAVSADASGAGGFAGLMEDGGKITGCYALGAVSGGSNVGGFVGTQAFALPPTTIDAGPIESCYSAGAVAGAGGNIGGFAGEHVLVFYSRWDIDRSGQTEGSGSGSQISLTGMTTAQMMSAADPVNNKDQWDVSVSEEWGLSNHYPYLKNMPSSAITFTATDGGTVFGAAASAQIFNHGVDAAAAAALTDVGESFDGWYIAGTEEKLAVGTYEDFGFSVAGFSADSMAMTLTGITADSGISIDARFTVKKMALTYIAMPNGKIIVEDSAAVAVDSAVLTVPYNTVGPKVTAVPDPGYRFTEWESSGGENSDAPDRADTAAAPATFTAYFQYETYAVTYTAGTGGRLMRDGGGALITSFTISPRPRYGDAVTVEAVPLDGYRFVMWSDSLTDSVRTDTVRGNIGISAEFELAPIAVLTPDRVIPVPPTEDAAVITPVTPSLSDGFTAGPNIIHRGDGVVKIYRVGAAFGRPRSAGDNVLTVYGATGSVITKIPISDNTPLSTLSQPSPGNGNPRRIVGVWDLRDAKGRPVAEGTYLLRGVVRTADGKRERVSLPVSVR